MKYIGIFVLTALLGASIGCLTGISTASITSEIIAMILGLVTLVAPFYFLRKNKDKKLHFLDILPLLFFLAIFSCTTLIGNILGIKWRVEENLSLYDRRVKDDIEHRKLYIDEQIKLNEWLNSNKDSLQITNRNFSLLDSNSLELTGAAPLQLSSVELPKNEEAEKAMVMAAYANKNSVDKQKACEKIGLIIENSTLPSLTTYSFKREIFRYNELKPLHQFVADSDLDSIQLKQFLKSISQCFCE